METLLQLMFRAFMATADYDACLANDLAYDTMHAIGACVWNAEIEDGECWAEGATEVIYETFQACQMQGGK